ncbi:MAG TPA: flagellar filament capping protein FliD [Bryobacteraceae bacterium]
MASSSTSPASVASLTAPPTFSGVSKFAGSLQQVLSRAVGIASLPLDSDQATLNDLNTTHSDLQGLDTVFAGLQQSLNSLQSALTSNLLTSSVSDPGTVSATVGTGAAAGTYAISVNSLGAFSTALSNAGSSPVTDPTTQGISNSATFTLSIGGAPTTITPASTSLQDLAAAINSQSSGQVQATLVNVGSTSSPDYRLSLQATSLGTDGIDLTDSSSSDLIQTATPGSPASYTVGGLTTPVNTTSRTITLSPGLTVSLLAKSAAGASTTITVADNPSALASAFSSFAGSYNAAVDAISQYHGQNGGALEGDSLLQTLTGVLNQLGNYSNGSADSALANFGITLDQTGQLSVDTTAFTNAANANFPALLSTLGGVTSGGFLETATNLLNGIEDPETGALKTEETSVASQITKEQTVINNEQASVNQLQTNLTQQISQADSAIAELESQVSYVTGLFAQYTGATNTQSNGLATL